MQSESGKKQAGGGAAHRELSSAGGAETRTGSVQPSAKNSKNSGGGGSGSTSSRQSFGSHFLCSSDRFKHSGCKEALYIFIPALIPGPRILAFKMQLSRKSLPERLHGLGWVIGSSPLLARDFSSR